MGTNYYNKKDDSHIGKRSAAGMYCWDCDVTLCMTGIDGIHYNHDYYKCCPECGKKMTSENFTQSSAGREMGLNKKPYGRKKGVASCSSFTWAVDPIRIPEGTIILDEYGREMTLEYFWRVLEECPVQFYHSIGKEFC